MIVLGLTGSIGMGKTTAARHFRRLGAPVFEADATVHGLYGPGGAAVAPVLAAFPGCARMVAGRQAVDRALLGRRVFGDAAALARLEAIVHPLVRAQERRFLAAARRRRAALAVLDIPLLYEAGGEERCDAVAVVHAPAFVQESRVLGRAGMTRARLRDIMAQQMTSREKCRRADFVIPTGVGRRAALIAVGRIIRTLRARGATRRGPWRARHTRC
ncbi:MAG: dephospho-CoA kinase [Alphaproteobacteria bacterium]